MRVLASGSVETMRKIDNIQIARGLAALVVFLFHFHEIETIYSDDVLTPSFFQFGRMGVDLFFVISGFLMIYISGHLAPGLDTARNFLIRRIFRIYPLYWFVTLSVLAVYFASDKTMFDGVVRGAPNILSSLLLVPDMQDPIIRAGWTLLHEVYFYAVFAALLIFTPSKWRLHALL